MRGETGARWGETRRLTGDEIGGIHPIAKILNPNKPSIANPKPRKCSGGGEIGARNPRKCQDGGETGARWGETRGVPGGEIGAINPKSNIINPDKQ